MERSAAEGLGCACLLGETFTAADILVGSNLPWGTLRRLFPENGAVSAYVGRCAERLPLKCALSLEEGFVEDQN